MATPHFATRSAPPSTVTALFAFARARMQSAPLVVTVFVACGSETTARAMRVGVGIDWTGEDDPGSSDAFVVSHCAVFCVISTTTQGGVLQIIARESRDRTVPQLSPLDVTRHTFEVGIVNPL